MGIGTRKGILGIRLPVLVPCVVAIGCALGWTRHYKQAQIDGAKNYVLSYAKPDGWKSAPHGPQTLFKYVDPKTDVCIRGAANQMVAEVNPSPELDTDGIADYYIDRTHESMPGWTAAKLGTVMMRNKQPFELISRGTGDRTVITAYAVKGNTTILITLFGMNRAQRYVEGELPFFEQYLATLSLQEKDLSNL